MRTKNILIDYYKNEKLEVLDKGKIYGEFDTNHYAAVSLNYLHKFLLKEKVSKKFVARKIFELCKEKKLFPIPCSYAGGLVFCNYNFQKDRYFYKFIIGDKKVETNKYDSNYLIEFNKLLK